MDDWAQMLVGEVWNVDGLVEGWEEVKDGLVLCASELLGGELDHVFGADVDADVGVHVVGASELLGGELDHVFEAAVDAEVGVHVVGAAEVLVDQETAVLLAWVELGELEELELILPESGGLRLYP